MDGEDEEMPAADGRRMPGGDGTTFQPVRLIDTRSEAERTEIRELDVAQCASVFFEMLGIAVPRKRMAAMRIREGGKKVGWIIAVPEEAVVQIEAEGELEVQDVTGRYVMLQYEEATSKGEAQSQRAEDAAYEERRRETRARADREWAERRAREREHTVPVAYDMQVEQLPKLLEQNELIAECGAITTAIRNALDEYVETWEIHFAKREGTNTLTAYIKFAPGITDEELQACQWQHLRFVRWSNDAPPFEAHMPRLLVEKFGLQGCCFNAPGSCDRSESRPCTAQMAARRHGRPWKGK